MKLSIRVRFRKWLIVFFSLFSFFCAGQLPPPGGPEDKTPPEVLLTDPSPGTLRFHADVIKIKFSKNVSPLSVEQSVFLSPNLGQLSYDWGWSDVEIHFVDSLRPNTTYILTIGTDAEDTHHNKLVHAFALPFSTGDKIDSAGVSGRVYDSNPSGVMIFAYKLDGRLADTLSPSRTKPDFLTQTGKDGTFALTNLAAGTYRIFAIHDQYRNLLYDLQVDDYGTLPSDVTLSTATSSISNLQFRMTIADTSLPFLSSAKGLNRTRVLVRFSKPMDRASIPPDSVSIIDTLSRKALEIKDVSFLDPPVEAHITTGEQDSERTYRVTLHAGKDFHGNLLSLANDSAMFQGGARPDTMKPSLKFLTGSDSMKNIDPNDTLWMNLSRPVHREKIARGVHLFDSVNTELPCGVVWFSSTRGFLKPPDLMYGEWYTIKFDLDSLVDFDGNSYHDSTLVRHFSTLSTQTLGSVEGTIGDELTTERCRIYLILQDVLSKSSPYRMVGLDSAGRFTVDHIREGKYFLWAFRDRDTNGLYTYGHVFPYEPSERFAVYPDTLKIRARWPLEGVALKLGRF